MKETIKIALTGHRPQKLGGFDYYTPKNLAIATKLREYLLFHLNNGKQVHAISGMALGADTIFALVALKLKRQGYDVKLEAAIPCTAHASQWPQQSQDQWKNIVEQSDVVTYVSKLLYKPYLMQKRNEYMVNQCHELLAIFDGSAGGTANCVKYAEQKGKKIVLINPKELIIQHKGDILHTDCDVVMHQANCRSTMGSGIAKQIRAEFPIVYAVDCASPFTPEEKLGTYTHATVQNNGKNIEIVNLYGQLNYGSDRKLYTNYEALEKALFSYLSDRLLREGDLSQLKIGVPKFMGCARAGGDWKVVTEILETACKEFNISIHTYQFGE
ncbi:SLOG family protein [Gottfriedia acidiceleris]|uniref:SLOG family protein n=1 Tax=Gottfriedia acidiceleris TaxID=371036 RepID=UPI003397F38B